MKEVRLNKKKVVLYDSIEELPITRFHKYNKMLLVDSGVGSDLDAFNGHIERVIRYINKNDLKNAAAELENLRQNVYFIQSNVSPHNLAFAVLVQSIDGRACDDLTDDGLQKTLAEISGEKQKEVTEHFDSVKKKIDEELRLYFPALFDSSIAKEYYDKLKKRTEIILKKISGKEIEQSDIDGITDELVLFNDPKKFGGSESVEIRQDKQFERMCLLISENLHTEPKKFTVLEYYNALEYLKEMAKKAEKLTTKNK